MLNGLHDEMLAVLNQHKGAADTTVAINGSHQPDEADPAEEQDDDDSWEQVGRGNLGYSKEWSKKYVSEIF